MSDDRSASGRGADRSAYVESQVIMTTVRVVAPFAFTYGLFLAFHGGGSPGGGFQGGAIVGATVLMIAFAFGIEPTREWLSNRVVTGLVSAGVVAFALIGLVPLLFRGRFLEHHVYAEDLGIYHGEVYALEGVEIVGIAPIVAAAVVGLFFVVAAGARDSDAGDFDAGGSSDDGTSGRVAPDDAAADGGAVAVGDANSRDGRLQAAHRSRVTESDAGSTESDGDVAASTDATEPEDDASVNERSDAETGTIDSGSDELDSGSDKFDSRGDGFDDPDDGGDRS